MPPAGAAPGVITIVSAPSGLSWSAVVAGTVVAGTALADALGGALPADRSVSYPAGLGSSRLRRQWRATLETAIARHRSRSRWWRTASAARWWRTWRRARSPRGPALLVAPADVDSPDRTPPETRSSAPMPTARLPFPATVIASGDDPYVTLARARLFAGAWGAAFVDAGRKGTSTPIRGWGTGLRGAATWRRWWRAPQCRASAESAARKAGAPLVNPAWIRFDLDDASVAGVSGPCGAPLPFLNEFRRGGDGGDGDGDDGQLRTPGRHKPSTKGWWKMSFFML